MCSILIFEILQARESQIRTGLGGTIPKKETEVSEEIPKTDDIAEEQVHSSNDGQIADQIADQNNNLKGMIDLMPSRQTREILGLKFKRIEALREGVRFFILAVIFQKVTGNSKVHFFH